MPTRRTPVLSLAAPALLALSSLGLVGLVGCNDPTNDVDVDGRHKPARLPTPATQYPDATVVAKGAVVPNFVFDRGAFINAQVQNEKLDVISLGDFFNPHADDPDYLPESAEKDDRVFPPGSPYGGGRPKPRAIVIAIGSVWCGPCNEEAKKLLPLVRPRYAACGGEILYQLIESAAPGALADEKNLRAWTKVYKVDYPTMIDPLKQLANLYPTGNYPDAAIVDTRTMTMVEAIQGVADDAFWGTFEGMLDADCLATQP